MHASAASIHETSEYIVIIQQNTTHNFQRQQFQGLQNAIASIPVSKRVTKSFILRACNVLSQ